MPAYRLLFFRGGQLDSWEAFEADDHIAALEEAARHPSEGLMELWSEHNKVASFRPVGTHHSQMKATRLPPVPRKKRS